MNKLGKLNPEFKAKWIAALRSGEYKQGANFLNNPKDNSFCCLGVACVVSDVPYFATDKHIVTGEDVRRPLGLPCKEDARGWWLSLPEDTNSIDSPEVLLPGHRTPTRLSELNDELGFTFAQIADLVEAQL